MHYNEAYLRQHLIPVHGFKPLYRLRWRFEYHEGVKPRYGGWNLTSQLPVDMAMYVRKTRLARAIIEGEMVGTNSLKTLVEVDGHAYAHSKWNVVMALPSLNLDRVGTYTNSGDIIGLSFYTNDCCVTAFIDGRVMGRDLKPEEKLFKVAEHTEA